MHIEFESLHKLHERLGDHVDPLDGVDQLSQGHGLLHSLLHSTHQDVGRVHRKITQSIVTLKFKIFIFLHLKGYYVGCQRDGAMFGYMLAIISPFSVDVLHQYNLQHHQCQSLVVAGRLPG